MTSSPAHRWKFFRTGGLDQASFDRGADLARLRELDQKLWVALACPVQGLDLDPKTLALIDANGDGRIRAPELIDAVEWAVARLHSPDVLVKPAAALPLAAIKDPALLESAKFILAGVGRAGAAEISVDDSTKTIEVYAKNRFNGDGIVPPAAAADDAATAQAIADLVATVGGQPDRSGAAGADAASLDGFFGALAAFDAWWKTGEKQGAEESAVLPLGERTPAAAATLRAVEGKIADYFSRCRLAAFDPRATAALNRAEGEYAAIAGKDLATLGADVAALPLARVEPGRPLPLGAGLNPAWTAHMAAFAEAVVEPLLGPGKTELTEADLASVQAKLAPFAAWQGSKGGAAVEKLGIARIRELLAGDARAKIAALIAEDAKLAAEVAGIEGVERLCRYHRDLYRLVHNFVNFTEFYASDRWAVFQAGTLYLDGRACKLAIDVTNLGRHGTMAPLSKMYVAYVDLTRGAAKKTVAVGLTNGDAQNLMVGRNGIFYDRAGQDWDATIIKLVESPISLREAFFAPYQLLGRLIESQIEKFASSREKDMQAKMASGVETTAAKVTAPPPAGAAAAPAQPANMGNMVGILAAVGLALGAIGGAVATAAAAFLGLEWWQMPLAVLGVLLLISGPSMIMAYLKLRQRTLGPLLDANGWAINGRVKITVPFGVALTALAKLPPNAERSLVDPYAEKRRPWWLYIALAVVVAVFLVFYQYGWTPLPRPWLETPGALPPPDPAPAP